MIIRRISGGLANSMLEFASAYALSKVRNEPLVLDISPAVINCRAFSLDLFRIPELTKIISFQYGIDLTNTVGIPSDILTNACAYSDSNEYLDNYDNLNSSALLHGDPIILCGYFFSREKYYAPFFDEIRAMFVPREKNLVLEYFDQLASGYDTVGIHIRRGDFLLQDWTYIPSADFFRAAIAWYRHKLSRPRFFIFSDDINFAKNILGSDTTFFYVHPFGHIGGDFSEFLCLLRCKHKILSNNSSFSRLAYDLNNDPEKTAMYRLPTTSLFSLNGLIERIKLFRRKTNINRCEENHIFYMNSREENTWIREFKTDGIDNMKNYYSRFESICNSSDDLSVIRDITFLCMNVNGMSEQQRKALAYRLFIAHANLCNIDDALELAYDFWFSFDNMPEFHYQYAQILQKAGYNEEADVEFARYVYTGESCLKECLSENEKFVRCKKTSFLVIFHDICFGSITTELGLIPLGLILRRLGHDVTFLFRTGNDKVERHYIQHNPFLTTRAGVCLGCFQFSFEDVVASIGLEKFFNNFLLSSPAAVMVTDDAPLRDIALRCGLRTVFCGAASDGEEGRLLNIAVASAPSPGYSLQKGRWRARQNHRLRTADIDCAARICRWLSRSGNDS